MTRQIKFRVWNKVDKVLYQPHAVSDEIFSNSALEVMQFTGMLDCNGKEIYEGDILKYIFSERLKETMEKYEFQKKQFGVVEYKGTGFIWIKSKPEKQEIIGNIYENPELL